ncbi:D-alanyl-D-alanine carboxypeptidase [Cryobacterium psychrotolerans]|uniref:D-alanyl-D-alanine carboxypeptidase n=1 Tax=Cryobacterium psychrotolerans TaxID=386301 RepID=A0A1G8ZB66_9MICO|nr:D-alanyl-D-alanine carboxypeptidase [Cryobacterium psychrotolerans]
MLATLGVVTSLTLGAALTGSPSQAQAAPEQTLVSRATTKAFAVTSAVVFNRNAASITDPRSPWVVVNKKRPLNPPQLRASARIRTDQLRVAPVAAVGASKAATKMLATYQAETGRRMQSQSAYRSYATQVSVYNASVRIRGVAATDKIIARPGTSEHQTGWAIDVSALPSNCSLSTCFANTHQGKWLSANAWRFGFLLRYPANKVAVTGYSFEPWHYRFVGPYLTTEMRRTGFTTLEEFFRLPAAPSY